MGGGCRKNKRSSSSKRVQDQPLTPLNNPLGAIPSLSYDSNDLTLALVRLQKQSTGQLGFDDHDLSILGNPTSSHFDILGNNANPGFLDAFRSGFVETHPQNNNLQNMYCGYGNGDMGEVDNGSAEMMLPYDHQEVNNNVPTTQAVSVTTMKQEMMCNGREQSENKVLWGLPWQFNNADINMGGFDSGRAGWNSGLGSSWHGLLNSPLM